MQLGPVRKGEWLFLCVLGLVTYVLLPLSLVLANLTLLLYGISRLWLAVAALVFSAYYEQLSSYCHASYSACKERLLARTQAKCTFQRVVESHRPHYNQLCFNM